MVVKYAQQATKYVSKAMHHLQYRENEHFLPHPLFYVFILGAVKAKFWVNALVVLK